MEADAAEQAFGQPQEGAGLEGGSRGQEEQELRLAEEELAHEERAVAAEEALVKRQGARRGEVEVGNSEVEAVAEEAALEVH